MILEEIMSSNGIKKAKVILNKLKETNKKMEDWLKLTNDTIGEGGIAINDINDIEFVQLKNRINVKDNELTQIITSLGPKFKTDHETIKKLKKDGVKYYEIT